MTNGIGRFIREARRQKGLSQAELAKRIGLTQSGISMIERGLIVPRLPTLLRIFRELELSVDLLKEDPNA
ncbi:helix-turn-helix transcriptional regulator [Thermus sp.]|uniref:XRE family transcriptional regulator n=1 Tax=Thermus caliditerrae TaxID=1330700 RepID=A0A7C5REN8_9DEIN